MIDTKWTGQEVDGYQVLQPPEGSVEIWDADEHLFSLGAGATLREVKAAIHGYRMGDAAGIRSGHHALQFQLRRLLGITP